MDRGAWWATVHAVAELDTTEQLTLSLSWNSVRPREQFTLKTQNFQGVSEGFFFQLSQVNWYCTRPSTVNSKL